MAKQQRPLLAAMLVAGALALTGCAGGGDTATTDDAPAASEDATQNGDGGNGGSASGSGTATVTFDGGEAGEWGPTRCIELDDGDIMVSSSTPDGGNLTWQLAPTGTHGGVVFLTPPGGEELSDYSGGELQTTGEVYTFTGSLRDDMYAPTVEFEATIEVDCAAA